jgi:hypothetical protein
MTIIAGLIYYNEADFLPMVLESLEGKIDEIIAVDGKILGFPGRGFLSSDGSTEIIEDAGGRIYGGVLWKTEMDKRQVYLDAAKNGDQILIIDADEILRGELPMIPDFYVTLVHSFYESAWRLRLLKKTQGLIYGYTHWQVVDYECDWDEKSRNGDVTKWHLSELYHLDFLRSFERRVNKMIFTVNRKDPVMIRTFNSV